MARRNADIMLAHWCATNLYDDNGTIELIVIMCGALKSGLVDFIGSDQCRNLVEQARAETHEAKHGYDADMLVSYCIELMLSFFCDDEAGRVRLAAGSLAGSYRAPEELIREVIDGQT